jgi:hypothetical protein
MSSGKILFNLSRQYPKLFSLSVVLGFSGAVFNAADEDEGCAADVAGVAESLSAGRGRV